MGEACKLSCGHCSYNQEVFLGIGFQYINLISILEWYKEDVGRQRIREFMNLIALMVCMYVRSARLPCH